MSLIMVEDKGSAYDRRPRESDDTLIIFDDEDVKQGVEECERSLVVRIITEKPINKGSFHSAVASVWGSSKGLRVEEVVETLFQIFFEDGDTLNRVLKGSPWLFRNSWVLVQQWRRDCEPEKMVFDKAEL